MSTVNAEIKWQGNDDAWFTANASEIFDANIQIFHIDGRYKFTDGITALSALPFRGSGSNYTLTPSEIGSVINGAASATPNDSDLVISVESSVAKKNTWTQIKSFLKNYFESNVLTAYQSTSEKGANNGYASLDSGGKVPASQLPYTLMTLQGNWNATTNTPTLANGVGDVGDVYECTVAGTVDFGAGPITFKVGDWAVCGAGSVWYKSLNSNEVTSVNGQTGTVVLSTNHISEGTNLYFTDARARSAAVENDLMSSTTVAPSKSAVNNALAGVITQITDISSTSTIRGFSSYTRKEIYMHVNGNSVIVTWWLEGAGSGIDTDFTLPVTSIINLVVNTQAINNGGAAAVGRASIASSTNLVALSQNIVGSAYSGTGTRRSAGSLTLVI